MSTPSSSVPGGSKNNNRVLTLKSSDGQILKVKETLAVQSELLKRMVEEGCTEGEIPLGNITGPIQTKIVEWCNKHEDGVSEKEEKLMTKWEREFIDALSQEDSCSLSQKVADMMEGKSAEELREMFNNNQNQIEKVVDQNMEDNRSLDKLSELPDPILHQIMSLLSLKEVIQISTLSKSLQKAWQTCPVLKFDQNFFWEIFFKYEKKRYQVVEEKREILFNFLEQTKRNRERHSENSNMQQFTIVVWATLFRDERFVSLVDKWISHAVDSKVKEMGLEFYAAYMVDSYYTIPQVIFSANSLQVLELKGCRLELPRRCKKKLNSLKKLCLEGLEVYDFEIESLIYNCPMIEDLSVIRCLKFQNLKLSGLCKLKNINVVNYSSKEFRRIEIGAPNLQSASIHVEMTRFDIQSCKKLRCLTLSMALITDSNQISQLPLLEYLNIENCKKLKTIELSSPCLKTLIIFRCYELVEIKINSPKLSKFKYIGKLIKFSSHYLALYEADIDIVLFKTFNDISRFVDYFRFLENFSLSVVLNLTCDAIEEVIVPEWMRPILTPPLFGVKCLSLKPCHQSRQNLKTSEILDGLLWIAPHAENISISTLNSSTCKSSFKFSYKKQLVDEGEIARCCKSLPISYWQQCIKKVEMKNIVGPLKEDEIHTILVVQEEDVLKKIDDPTHFHYHIPLWSQRKIS